MRMMVMSAIVALAGWAAGAGTVAAQGMAWIYTNRTPPGPGSPASASLVYGVPFSDALLVNLTCEGDRDGAMVDVTFFSEIGALPDGAPTQIQIGAPGQDGMQLPGQILSDRDLTGLTGARTRLPIDHAFFDALGTWPAMSMNVPGQRGVDLPIQEGRGEIARFLSACGASAPDAPGTPEAAAGTAQLDCSTYSTARSISGDVAQQVTFSNETDDARVLFWIDYQGQPTQIAIVEPGLWVTIDTYLTHPWLITDMAGTCRQVMRPLAGQDRFQIAR